MRAITVTALVLACGGPTPPRATPPIAPHAAPRPIAIDAGAVATSRPRVHGNPSTALVPRLDVFATTRYSNVRLAPDGKRLAWLEPRTNITMPYVAPIDDLKAASLVATDTTRPVTALSWTADSKHLMYLQDPTGDGNPHLFRWDLDTAKVVDLVPIKGARVDLIGIALRKPALAIVGINDRDPQADDLYEVDIKTGDKKRIVVNDDRLGNFVVDSDLKVRLAAKQLADGSLQILRKDPSGWTVWDTIAAADRDTTRVLGFDPRGTHVYVADGRGRDTAAMYSVDVATKQRRLLAEDPKADATSAFLDPATGAIGGVGFARIRTRWVIVDKAVAADAKAIDKLADGPWEITSATKDGARWLVAFDTDTQPGKYFLYDRKHETGTFLFDMTPSLASLPLAHMHGHEIAARDGLGLVVYVSLPHDRDPDGDGLPDRPLPLVVLVGPDPTQREMWAYDQLHQFIASRGYAAMSVNFRGMTGYGKAFANAGAHEWGNKMETDLVDAVRWAVDHRIADAARVGIVGMNYGGYAALMALATAPDTFACAVDILGPADLVTYAKLTSPQLQATFRQKIGDPDTDAGVAALRASSPLAHARAITKPLLVVHSGEAIAGADTAKLVDIVKRRAPVTFVVFPDEPVAITRPENVVALLAAIEAFLSEPLGGWFAPLEPAMRKATSLEIKVGAENLPGF